MSKWINLKGDELEALDIARAELDKWTTSTAPGCKYEVRSIEVCAVRSKYPLDESWRVKGFMVCSGVPVLFSFAVLWYGTEDSEEEPVMLKMISPRHSTFKFPNEGRKSFLGHQHPLNPYNSQQGQALLKMYLESQLA